MPGDPVWLLLIGPPSGSKTEILNTLSRLPNFHRASTVTESALLSGTPAKEVRKGSKNGLLREIVAFGVLVLKDFTSILAMNRDQRAGVLAAFREIFDGSCTRRLGTDGGADLRWEGKLGLIAACTPAIDQLHEVIASMGDRYLRLRMPAIDGEAQAMRSFEHGGGELDIRAYLADKVRDFFSALDFSKAPPVLTLREQQQIACLSSLVALARSAVERDPRTRDIELIPEPELPARLTKSLSSLFIGVIAIGADREFALSCVTAVAMDCIPKVRRQVLDIILANPQGATVAQLQADTLLPFTTVRRALVDLRVHGVIGVRRKPKSKNTDPNGSSGVVAPENGAAVPDSKGEQANTSEEIWYATDQTLRQLAAAEYSPM